MQLARAMGAGSGFLVLHCSKSPSGSSLAVQVEDATLALPS